MLSALKELFDAFLAPPGQSAQERDQALRLATAVLLVDVMRADQAIDAAERNTVLTILREQCSLADADMTRLVNLAELTARNASDHHQFTSRINDSFTHPQKNTDG
ncbi:MAG: TerB family tellurite resistance protein [Polaromonas sp.]